MITNPLSKILGKAQDLLESKVSNERKEILLRPSALWAKSITWTLIGGTAFGIGWLGVAKTEEIVIAQGKLEPKTGVIDVQMPMGGVAKNIMIKEGQEIKKGQILIQMDNRISLARLNAIENKLQMNQEIMKGLEPLLNQGAISKIQYFEQKKRIEDLIKEKIETKVLIKYQQIKSPVNGIVFDLKPTGAGFVGRSSEPVMKIVPNEKLVARVEINSTHIGFVSVGKIADISIDSYPASDFGVLEGELVKISSDALPPDPRLNKGYRFPAEIKLKTQHLNLKNDKSLPLQAGMSLTANIKLRKVSYLQLLLNTFSQKADSLRSI